MHTMREKGGKYDCSEALSWSRTTPEAPFTNIKAVNPTAQHQGGGVREREGEGFC